MSDRKRTPWDGIISEEEQRAYRAAGFGRKTGLGQRPALMIIDVQYRTVGTEADAVLGSDQGIPDVAAAMSAGRRSQTSRSLLAAFREKNWPVLYPHVSPKQTFDKGRLADKVPAHHGYRGERLRVRRRDRAARRRHPACRRSIRARSSARRSRAIWSIKAPTRVVVTGCTTSRMRPRQRRRCVRLQFPCRRCRTMRSTTAARPRTPSTCSTWRRNTPTCPTRPSCSARSRPCRRADGAGHMPSDIEVLVVGAWRLRHGGGDRRP